MLHLLVISAAVFTSERMDACSSGWVEVGTEQPCCLHGCLHSSYAQKSKYTCGLGRGGTGPPSAQEEMNLCIATMSCCFWCAAVLSQMKLQPEALHLLSQELP